MTGGTIRKNKVQVAGEGSQAVIFGNGFGTDLRAWRFVAPAFAARGRVVTFDHVGFGGSDLTHPREMIALISEYVESAGA